MVGEGERIEDGASKRSVLRPTRCATSVVCEQASEVHCCLYGVQWSAVE